MTAREVGPIWTGGFEIIGEDSDYPILFLPDKHNDDLQAEGKPPVYYWLPDSMRLAAEPDGDLKFSFVHFTGVQTGESSPLIPPGMVKEMDGGAMNFAVTAKLPDGVLQEAHATLLEKCKSRTDRFRRWDSERIPLDRALDSANLRSVPVTGSTVSMTNASMNPDGSLDTANAFFWKMQGPSGGAASALAETAFTCMMGSTAAAIVSESLDAEYMMLSVRNAMQIPVWAPVVSLRITSDWERVFNHFNGEAKAKYFWASADIKTIWNDLRTKQVINVELEVDKTIPGHDQHDQMIKQFMDTIITAWMDQAKQVIFAPIPEVAPVHADEKKPLIEWPIGAGLQLRAEMRRDVVESVNAFKFTVDYRFLQEHTVSSPLRGLADLPKEERGRYRRVLDIADWSRKLTIQCWPVARWEHARGALVDPVNALSVQIGYPDRTGSVVYDRQRVFQRPAPVEAAPKSAVTDPTTGQALPADVQVPTTAAEIAYKDPSNNEMWFARIIPRALDSVKNPPLDWAPGKWFVKRSITINELDTQVKTETVHLRISYDLKRANNGEVELDGDDGTLTNDLSLPVSVSMLGYLEVGPISPFPALPDGHQLELKLRADDVPEKEVRFIIDPGPQQRELWWRVYSDNPHFRPTYKYCVILRGPRKPVPREEEEWIPQQGDGPLVVEFRLEPE